jgi:hypothetical protein
MSMPTPMNPAGWYPGQPSIPFPGAAAALSVQLESGDYSFAQAEDGTARLRGKVVVVERFARACFHAVPLVDMHPHRAQSLRGAQTKEEEEGFRCVAFVQVTGFVARV